MAAGVAALGALSALLPRGPADPFVLAQWQYSYSLGFVRRGLLGTLLDAIGFDGPMSVAVVAATLYVTAVLAIAVVVAHLTTTDRRVDPLRASLAFGVLASPAGLPFLAANAGRFDTVTLLLLILAAVLAPRLRGAWLAVGALPLLVAVLVHEAALVTTGVWGAVVLAGRRWTSAPARAVVVCLVPVAIATLLVVSLQQPPMEPAAFRAWLETRTGWPVTGHHEVAVPYQSVAQASRLTLGWLATAQGQLSAGLSLLAVLPTLVLIPSALRDAGVAWHDLDIDERLLAFAALAPLGLVVVGMDWGRWTSLSVLLLGATALRILARRGARHRPSLLTVGAMELAVIMTVLAGGTRHLAFLGGVLGAR